MDTATLPSSISPAHLAPRLGRADSPLLLDVRRRGPFEASPVFLAGARWCAPEDVAALATREPARPVVAYCVYGHGVGCEAARVLAQAGWDARWLEGGIEGGEPGVDPPAAIEHWRATALPIVRKRPEWGVTATGSSRWVTRDRPKIDRIACPWLIRRFIDPNAEFFYLPEGEVFEQAPRLGAVPFDMEGAPLGHEWERCSFDALLQAFDLRVPALDRLAAIVRAADTDRLGASPQAAGLLALSMGLSRLHKDDTAMLAAAMTLYDALYEWCDGAQGERHTWRAHAAEVAA